MPKKKPKSLTWYRKKAIPNFAGYYADASGDIWSKWTRKGAPQNRTIIGVKFRKLKPYRNKKDGYLYIGLRRKGVQTMIQVHRLVLFTFVGPCPEGMEACHENGKRDDPRLSNLRWDTFVNNNKDKIKHGTLLLGEQCSWTKLVNEDVVLIKMLLRDSDISKVHIAAIFNTTSSIIFHIAAGHSWRHIKI